MTKPSRLTSGAAMLCLLLASCSDKNDNTPLPDLSTEKTYTGNTLELRYNGELMPGKTAKVKMNGQNADITFSCSFDLSQLTGMGLSGTLPGPGVTPGDPVLTLSALASAGKSAYDVAGSGSTDYVDFSYTGSIGEDKMVFNISDARLRKNPYSGNVFVPAPLRKEGLLSYSSMPFHLVWEIDPAAGIDLPLSDILKVAVTAPVIPVYNNTAYTSVAEAFTSMVKSIALTEAGNIPVMYISTLGGAAHLATTSGNMMQYIPAQDGMKLYLNPLSVVGEVLLATSDNKNDDKFDFAEMLKRAPRADAVTDAADSAVTVNPELLKAFAGVLLKAFAPQLPGGIPLTVAPTATGADIYLDTATSVTFLSTVLQDAMQHPTIMEALQNALASAQLPEIDPAELAGLLQKLPQFLIATTKLEIGLSLVAKK